MPQRVCKFHTRLTDNDTLGCPHDLVKASQFHHGAWSPAVWLALNVGYIGLPWVFASLFRSGLKRRAVSIMVLWWWLLQVLKCVSSLDERAGHASPKSILRTGNLNVGYLASTGTVKTHWCFSGFEILADASRGAWCSQLLLHLQFELPWVIPCPFLIRSGRGYGCSRWLLWWQVMNAAPKWWEQKHWLCSNFPLRTGRNNLPCMIWQQESKEWT